MNPGVSWLAEPIAAICEPRFATVMLEAVNRLSSELYQSAEAAGWRVANPLELQVRYLLEIRGSQKLYWVKPGTDPHPSALLHAILALRVYKALAEAGAVPAGAVPEDLPVAEQVRLFLEL